MTDAYLAIDFGTSNVHVSLINATTTQALVATSRKYGCPNKAIVFEER